MLKRLEQLWQTEGRAHQGDFISPFCQSPVDRGGGVQRGRRGGEERGQGPAKQGQKCWRLPAASQPTGWPGLFSAPWHRHAVLLANAGRLCADAGHTDASPPIYLLRPVATLLAPSGDAWDMLAGGSASTTQHTPKIKITHSLARSLAHLPKLSYVSYRYS